MWADEPYYKPRSITEDFEKFLYISPGLQIGCNFDKINIRECYYGAQLTVGGGNLINRGVAPALCFGYRKFMLTKQSEKYIDFQITRFFIVPRKIFPVGLGSIGIGVGKIYKKDYSSLKFKVVKEYSDFRFKVYGWLMYNFTYDYEIYMKSHNLSLIPVLPIPYPLGKLKR